MPKFDFSRHRLAAVAIAALAVVVCASAQAQDPDLSVFDWPGYEDPQLHRAYVEKFGSSPAFTFFGNEDEAFEKLRTGFKADIAHPCSTNVVKWRDAGLRRASRAGTTSCPASRA